MPSGAQFGAQRGEGSGIIIRTLDEPQRGLEPLECRRVHRTLSNKALLGPGFQHRDITVASDPDDR